MFNTIGATMVMLACCGMALAESDCGERLPDPGPIAVDEARQGALLEVMQSVKAWHSGQHTPWHDPDVHGDSPPRTNQEIEAFNTRLREYADGVFASHGVAFDGETLRQGLRLMRMRQTDPVELLQKIIGGPSTPGEFTDRDGWSMILAVHTLSNDPNFGVNPLSRAEQLEVVLPYFESDDENLREAAKAHLLDLTADDEITEPGVARHDYSHYVEYLETRLAQGEEPSLTFMEHAHRYTPLFLLGAAPVFSGLELAVLGPQRQEARPHVEDALTFRWLEYEALPGEANKIVPQLRMLTEHREWWVRYVAAAYMEAPELRDEQVMRNLLNDPCDEVVDAVYRVTAYREALRSDIDAATLVNEMRAEYGVDPDPRYAQ